ncbi:MAG: SUMF1/EgtB/PvdO family nonheme iron enzyme [Planctomycetes bacterium]|nr:SUMF1/EgtB/PvdO family nonheme iron enzyme [Planctomycetota bacterium]MCC7399313.1 SUMF1/EgtB/PvdO family nonheme iron enzyme [Planctomycetota bacterium]
MDARRFEQVRRLFHAAASMAPPARRAFLQQEADDDAELVQEVIDLFDLQTTSDSLVDGVQQAANKLLASEHPRQIGPYRILGVLGQGGMGTVYEALETSEIERRVALKVIKAGMHYQEIVQRFERERQALAMMDHIGIAKVYTCGTTELGQPYFVMELVRGWPITDYCNRVGLPLPKRLRLVRQLCAAVHHAHQKGIVHRDLKPSNVLVTDQDGVLRIKVIDFGLAKPVGETLPGNAYETVADDARCGTLAYMPPEQAMPGAGVDTRADIYAIGAMLYELLVGTVPRTFEGIVTNNHDAFAKVLQQADPPRPSVRLAQAGAAAAAEIAAHCRVPLKELMQRLGDDLDWITLKAIDNDRDRRYESAAALAVDLARHLNGDPVQAKRPTSRYRLRKFARRNRAKLATAGLFAATLLAAGIAITSKAVALAETVRAFNRLDAVVAMDRLQAGLEATRNEAVDNADVIQAWITDATEMLADRPEVAAAVASLPAPEAVTRGRRGDAAAHDFLRKQLAAWLISADELEHTEIPLAERRLRWVASVRSATTTPRPGRPSWDDVRNSLARADSQYAGKDIRFEADDVLGLAPIGIDSGGRWHFYHLRSAWDGDRDPTTISVPALGVDGQVTIDDGTGIIFTLLPGGTVQLGTRSRQPGELPSHTVQLAPFLVARHELTRGQWRRLGGEALFWHRTNDDLVNDVLGLRHPAENMSHEEAERLLGYHGLLLPTESQWEYACRAGTHSAWWCGDSVGETSNKENLLDAAAAARNPDWGVPGGHADLFVKIARVGAGAANAFGICDMHGNVQEWCRDPFTGPSVRPRKRDGLRIPSPPDTDGYFVVRGGSYQTSALQATSTSRMPLLAQMRSASLGIRACRPLRRADR